MAWLPFQKLVALVYVGAQCWGHRPNSTRRTVKHETEFNELFLTNRFSHPVDMCTKYQNWLPNNPLEE